MSPGWALRPPGGSVPNEKYVEMKFFQIIRGNRKTWIFQAKKSPVQEDKTIKKEPDKAEKRETIRVVEDGRLACDLCNYRAFKEVRVVWSIILWFKSDFMFFNEIIISVKFKPLSKSKLFRCEKGLKSTLCHLQNQRLGRILRPPASHKYVDFDILVLSLVNFVL